MDTTQLSPAQLAALKAQNKNAVTLGLVITFTVLSLICIILRFITRIKFINNVGLEDYFIAVAMVSIIRQNTCIMLTKHIIVTLYRYGSLSNHA